MKKPVMKKPFIKKPTVKTKTVTKLKIIPQKITKTNLNLIKNKVAVEATLKRVTKDFPSTKKAYLGMLDVVKKSTIDSSSLRKILVSEKYPEAKINSIIEPLENKSKQFMYDFEKFIEHSVYSQKNPKLQVLDLITFTRAEISATSYNKLKADILSKISKKAIK